MSLCNKGLIASAFNASSVWSSDGYPYWQTERWLRYCHPYPPPSQFSRLSPPPPSNAPEAGAPPSRPIAPSSNPQTVDGASGVDPILIGGIGGGVAFLLLIGVVVVVWCKCFSSQRRATQLITSVPMQGHDFTRNSPRVGGKNAGPKSALELSGQI